MVRAKYVAAILFAGLMVLCESCSKDKSSTGPTTPPASVWTSRTTGTTGRLQGICWSGQRFAVLSTPDLGDSDAIQALTSTDGTTWDSYTYHPPEMTFFYNVVWSGTAFVALCVDGAYKSTDGLHYQMITTVPHLPQSLFASNGTVYVFAGDSLYSSTDLTTWTPLALGGNFIAYKAANAFLSVQHAALPPPNFGEALSVSVSTNLTSWTTKFVDTVLSPSIVFVSSPTKHIVLTQGRVHVSPDGLTWSSAAFPDTQPIAAVWSGQAFLVVSETGAVYKSSDGQSWTKVPNSTIDANQTVVWAAACNGTALVAVGWGGHIWTAPLGQ